jgi:hypothetical protein
MEPGTSAQGCAVAQRAQQQHQAQGGWRPAAWTTQPLPPSRNPQESSMVLDDLDHRVKQENRRKPNAKVPYLARQMSVGRIPSAGWRNAPTLILR